MATKEFFQNMSSTYEKDLIERQEQIKVLENRCKVSERVVPNRGHAFHLIFPVPCYCTTTSKRQTNINNNFVECSM